MIDKVRPWARSTDSVWPGWLLLVESEHWGSGFDFFYATPHHTTPNRVGAGECSRIVHSFPYPIGRSDAADRSQEGPPSKMMFLALDRDDNWRAIGANTTATKKTDQMSYTSKHGNINQLVRKAGAGWCASVFYHFPFYFFFVFAKQGGKNKTPTITELHNK